MLYQGSNPTIPCYSSQIQCVKKENLGRCIVASGAIPRGSILLIEKPYAVALRDELTAFVCNDCGRPLFTDDSESGDSEQSVKCNKTSCAARWCDTACRKAAKRRHQFECGAPLAGDDNERLAARVVLSTPVELLVKYDPGGGEVKQIVGSLGCAGRKAEFRSDAFVSVASLVDHVEEAMKTKNHANLLQHHSFQRYMSQKQWPKSMSKGARSELLRRHLVSLVAKCECNMYGVLPFWRLDTNAQFAHAITSILPRHACIGLYAGTALMNHSCAPNVCLCFDGFALRAAAIRHIAAGEEVLSNYGPAFGGRRSAKHRRVFLQRQFKFRCACAACEGDLRAADEQIHGHKCDQCDGGWTPDVDERTCVKCGQQLGFTPDEVQKALEQFDLALDAANTEGLETTFATIEQQQQLNELETLKQKYFWHTSTEMTSRQLRLAELVSPSDPALGHQLFNQVLHTYEVVFGRDSEKYAELLAQTIMSAAAAGVDMDGRMRRMLMHMREQLTAAYGDLAPHYMAMRFGQMGLAMMQFVQAMAESD